MDPHWKTLRMKQVGHRLRRRARGAGGEPLPIEDPLAVVGVGNVAAVVVAIVVAGWRLLVVVVVRWLPVVVEWLFGDSC